MHSVWAGREISAFEGLERYDGKLSRTVLRERRAVRPLATRYEIERHKLQVPLDINAFVQYTDYQNLFFRDRIKYNVPAYIQ